MPTTPTYPGVYIEEIPSGVRTITGVPTSITAFVGRARKGPDNDPITINNYGDFERAFGGLWDQSRLGFAVRNFYQNGGSQAIIVRLVKGAGKATMEDRQKYMWLHSGTSVIESILVTIFLPAPAHWCYTSAQC